MSESSCEFNGFTNHVGFIVVTTLMLKLMDTTTVIGWEGRSSDDVRAFFSNGTVVSKLVNCHPTFAQLVAHHRVELNFHLMPECHSTISSPHQENGKKT